MGASPIYTRRMRRLMKIEGDTVPAIVKALQLDCGFPHQYMDVGWRLIDAAHAEFFLLHCGALLDVEPHGEARVVGMCHTIEDPTFDATAYATNPRARVRPLHRPPRTPKGRHPHCHWKITIDPENAPVGPAKNTLAVGALPLAQIENARAAEREPGIRSCFLFLFLFSFSFPVTCDASSPQTEYKKIQKEIKAQKEKLEQVKKRESSILTEIEETNRQMKTVENDLRKYKIRLLNTEGRISQVEQQISVSKDAIDKHRQWMKRKLRTIYKYGRNSDVVLLLLGAQDVTHLIRTGKNLEFITAHEMKRLSTYKENLRGLQEKENQLILLKKELTTNRAKVLAEEATLSGKKKNQEVLLTSVKREKSSYTKMLREMEESARKLLDIINKSDAGEGYTGRGFASLKGRLPWPVEGKVAIPFGSQKDPQFNTPVFRSGAFIESSSDSMAKAVHEGKVVFAEWFKEK